MKTLALCLTLLFSLSAFSEIIDVEFDIKYNSGKTMRQQKGKIAAKIGHAFSLETDAFKAEFTPTLERKKGVSNPSVHLEGFIYRKDGKKLIQLSNPTVIVQLGKSAVITSEGENGLNISFSITPKNLIK